MTDLAAVAARLDRLVARADRSARHVERRSLGARELEVRSGHPHGLDPLLAALAPPIGGRPALELDEIEPEELAFLEALGPADLAGYGGVRGLADCGWSVAWEPERGRFLALHGATGSAFFARGAALAPREVAEPFRPLLHWAAIADGHLALHAGGLARSNEAVLIAGPGGAGKSTLVRAAAAAGFEVLGDNIVELSPVPGRPARWNAHGIYASVKVRRPPAFPDALPRVPARWDDEAAKDVYCFGAAAPACFGQPVPVRALLVVDPTGGAVPRPLGRAAALLAVGPNTLAQYPLSEQVLFERCGVLARTLPAWVVGHLSSVAAVDQVLTTVMASASNTAALSEEARCTT